AWCFSCQRPGCSGNNNAHHAFKFHANAVITMYAPLLSKLSTAARKARTPPCNCASRFSWSHRSLADHTNSSALFASRWSIAEFGNLLRTQPLVLEAAGLDNGLLDVVRPLPGLRLHLITARPK